MTAEYKEADVGSIPNNWTVSNLEEVCERIKVGLATSVTKYYRKSGVPIIRNLNIKDGFFNSDDLIYLDETFAKANSGKAAKAFDVLTVHTGSNLGQTCVLPEKFDCCQTFTTLITTPNKKIIDPEYLCLHMSSKQGRDQMDRLKAGGGEGESEYW
ncbi:restriction endonuclease subunit S [Polynucleobacter sp. MWH-HuK1]|nr:restriction endonuclease subunit S [Polynucleobacter sp. MWH-HuK1]